MPIRSTSLLLGASAYLLLLLTGPLLKLLGLVHAPWWKAGVLLWLPGTVLSVLLPVGALLREGRRPRG